MIAFGEKAEQTLAQAEHPCKICVSMNLQNDKNYFEKLPLLSLILKRVVKEYPSVVFTLYKMSCHESVVNCIVEFSETRDWVSIINSYESNILVWESKEEGECFDEVSKRRHDPMKMGGELQQQNQLKRRWERQQQEQQEQQVQQTHQQQQQEEEVEQPQQQLQQQQQQQQQSQPQQQPQHVLLEI